MAQSSRRSFIKNSSSVLFSIAFLNPLGKIFAANNSLKKMPPWTELVDYARWCPTVHNLQPHQLKIISETEAELYYNPLRLLPVGDPESIFATVAMGIFIENLSIASAFYNAKVTIEKIFDPIDVNATSSTLFAKLTLSFSDTKEVLDRELILKRKTSRLHYDGKPLSEKTLSEMRKECQVFGYDLLSTNDEKKIDYIIQLNQETLFEDLESKSMREELNTLFRYNKQEAETKRDGLWAKCMGFSGGLMHSVFEKHKRWTKGLLKNLLSHRYKSSFQGTSSVCWFSGPFDSTNDWILAGRMFARNWLIITRENAYLQPFGSLITNKMAYEKINNKFEKPKNNHKLWMIFRAGYSKEPTRSFRLNTNEILI
jgi:hypothetical protein